MAAALFGLLVFFTQGGAAALDVTRRDWMVLGSDWAYHQVAWDYFLAAPWGFPLGDIPDLLYPVGTSVALTDAIPWLALPIKLLAPVLPENFQIIGAWMALCWALAGWFGARLAQTLGARPLAAALAGALFAVAPALMVRAIHDGLCAHFLVLAALDAVLARDRRATLRGAVWVPLVAFGVHPYLFAMVYLLALAALVRGAWVDRLFGWRTAGAVAAGMSAACVLFAWLFGLLGASFATDATGFTQYASDLATLVNPLETSWILPTFPGPKARWEGFGYLGLAGILLALGAVVLEVRARGRRTWRRSLPLGVVLVCTTSFALAAPIHLLGKPIIPTAWFWDHLAPLTGAFRSSGRFIWPLYYAVFAGALGVWLLRRPRAATWALAVVLVVQLADSKRAFFGPQFKKRAPSVRFDPRWALARGDYRHVVLLPPRCGDGSGTCCPGFTPRPRWEDQALWQLTARLGLSTNSGGVGRMDRRAHRRACDALLATVDAGALDARTIYQVAPGWEWRFLRGAPGAVCGWFEGALTCVAPDAPARFRESIRGE